MLALRWLEHLLLDLAAMAWVNRAPALSLTVLLFLVLGLVIGAAQVSAPFIYTLF